MPILLGIHVGMASFLAVPYLPSYALPFLIVDLLPSETINLCNLSLFKFQHILQFSLLEVSQGAELFS